MDSHWEDLRLTEEEEKIVDCSNTRDESFASRASMALAGKVLTVKPYCVTGLFAFLRQAWKVSKPFGIRELGDNLYVFQFFTMKDKNWVLQEGPWLFDRQLILLSEIQANLTPSEINFSYVNFWVRGYDIPFGYVSRSTATALASAFGGLVDYREDDDLGWSKYVAFRVCVDVRQPLLRGAITTFGNGVAKWVPFKYEKLPNFCYRCGRLGHVEEDCKMQEDMDMKGQYGEWMRDSPSPRRLNGKHNSKEIRNWVDGRDKAGAEGETPKTGVRKSLKEILQAANSSIKGNTNDMVVTPNKDNTEATSTMRKLNKEKSSVGTPASVDIVIPPEPSYASFFQALNIPTKINKGAAEIISRVDLIKKGEKVGNSLATLLSKLGIKPFANSLEMEQVDKDGSVYNPVVLDMTEDDLAQRFSSGVANVSALALSISYPAISAVPCMIANGYKNVLAISLETDYTFPLAEQVKEYHKDPSKFAAAVAPVVAADAGTVVSSAAAVALMEAIKEESEEEDNMFSLFDE